MTLFYEKINDNILIFNHISNKFPLKGWIHYCYLCELKTSRKQKYSNYNNINVIVCKDCKNSFKNKKYNDIDLKILSFF